MLKEIERLEKELKKDQNLSESIDIKKEDVLDELERMMEMLDRLQFEKDLDDAISELEKLEQEQKKLSETNDDTEKEQAELKERFEEIENEIDDLKEKSEELDMGDLDELSKEDGEEVKEEMDDAQEKQKKNSNKKVINIHIQNPKVNLRKNTCLVVPFQDKINMLKLYYNKKVL